MTQKNPKILKCSSSYGREAHFYVYKKENNIFVWLVRRLAGT
jgi:hypothetical protein